MTSTAPQQPEVGPLAILAFVAEVMMLAGMAWAGWDLGTSTVVSALLAVALPIAAAVVWGLWCAPRARFPLPRLPRWAVKMTLFSIATVLLLQTDPTPWAGLYGVLTWLLFLVSLPADRAMSPRST